MAEHLNVQQDILETFIDRGQLRRLAEPTITPAGKRIPGPRLDHPRQLALMHALVCFAHVAAGNTFTTVEIHPYIIKARHRDRLRDASGRRAVEQAYGLYRHLIRAVRADSPNALPKRHYQPIQLAPTDGDVERAQTTRAYLDAAKASDVEIRRDLLLQVAGRSPVSLRERLSTLRRNSPSLQEAWQQIDTSLREEPGDAKLDALIDHLRGLHARNETARAVVVAEDNPTTDYMRDAIEAFTDLKVTNKRRSVSAAEELAVQVAGLKEAAEDFITGEAKVLVAADVASTFSNGSCS